MRSLHSGLQGTLSSTARQPCVPSASPRCCSPLVGQLHASQHQGHRASLATAIASLPFDSAPAPCCSSGSTSTACFLLGPSARRQLKRTLKQTRKRLDTTAALSLLASPQPLAPSASQAPQPPTQPLPLSLEAELHQLTQRLRELSHEAAAPPSGSSSTVSAPSAAPAAAAARPTPALHAAPAMPTSSPHAAPAPLPLLGAPLPATAEGRIVVCQGAKCRALGGADVLRAVSELSAGSPGVEVLPCKCLGRCKQGPAMRVKGAAAAAAPGAAATAPASDAKGTLHTQVELQHLGATLHAHFN